MTYQAFVVEITYDCAWLFGQRIEVKESLKPPFAVLKT